MNSYNTESKLRVNEKEYTYFDITKISESKKMPYSIKILLENLLRNEDGVSVTKTDIESIMNWKENAGIKEISFKPARVLLQDFTGVPAVVDLAAMRDAIEKLGKSSDKINPLQPVELVIDHSVQVDSYGSPNSLNNNISLEFKRNYERYKFLKWGQSAFDNFKVVPPDTGIVHQINIEYLARGIFTQNKNTGEVAYPDTVVGTDSHTTMINGVGILGWGVGGIEAEASMLGQPISMLIPKVVGFEIVGNLNEGVTATDLVLTIVEKLRKHGVVGKFVEFYGEGLKYLSLGDRATIANMAPEYGATCGIFPIDDETINYMSLTNRSEQSVDLFKDYSLKNKMQAADCLSAEYSENLKINLTDIKPSIAGPKRPQDKIELINSKSELLTHLPSNLKSAEFVLEDQDYKLTDGDIVIAAITSCTNTSNPNVMVAAGILAKKAIELGCETKKWVKTSLAPGSLVVNEYLKKSNLMSYLEGLGFHNVGYGCTTCIGNSGPLKNEISMAIQDNDLTVASILSGNRNFEGRVHADVKLNYLASPPLVVAYAIAGTMNIDLTKDPISTVNGKNIYLKDIWPTKEEIDSVIKNSISKDLFEKSYSNIYDGQDEWKEINIENTDKYKWTDSSYIANPPFFNNITSKESVINEITNAKVLAYLGDSVTTDHISPAGNIKSDSPAGKYLLSKNVKESEFNSYGSRRGNHEVMKRGTFANIRLKNKLVPGVEGGFTMHPDSSEMITIFEASEKYISKSIPTIILAGKEYGCGSSRDWAAKGPKLLGVKAVIAESFERIHRSNLVGMGILPLKFKDGENAQSIGLTGFEKYKISNIDNGNAKSVNIAAINSKGESIEFEAEVCIFTPQEIEYFKNGGILPYVLKQLAA
ncbi:MAG: aconitate hydratase [Thiotrichaceae bacterium]|nr:MAG: aconitate hydratase [Thiotrichaceae bacterium]|tara:strand:- start:2474 stop:5098 length:2625 start_codon:yes stop_codon:yes gene_type:complete